jgi:hypothetical protein
MTAKKSSIIFPAKAPTGAVLMGTTRGRKESAERVAEEVATMAADATARLPKRFRR